MKNILIEDNKVERPSLPTATALVRDGAAGYFIKRTVIARKQDESPFGPIHMEVTVTRIMGVKGFFEDQTYQEVERMVDRGIENAQVFTGTVLTGWCHQDDITFNTWCATHDIPLEERNSLLWLLETLCDLSYASGETDTSLFSEPDGVEHDEEP